MGEEKLQKRSWPTMSLVNSTQGVRLKVADLEEQAQMEADSQGGRQDEALPQVTKAADAEAVEKREYLAVDDSVMTQGEVRMGASPAMLMHEGVLAPATAPLLVSAI